MDTRATDSLRRLASFLQDNQDRLTVDADAHPTDIASLAGAARVRYETEPGYYHGKPYSAEDILREMELAGVDMALLWQNPAWTMYTSDQDRNTEVLLAANRYVRDSAERHANKFFPAGWTDPKACGLKGALRLAEIFVTEFGFPIVKLNPAQNRYPIDSPEVLRVVDRIVELGAVPAFHFGADTPYTPADGLEAVARRHPDRPLLAVHMGGGGAGYLEAEDLYTRARQLGLRQPNLRYVLSAKRDVHMENDLITYQMAGEPWSRHLFCGSDIPYGHMGFHFAGYRAMLKGFQNPSLNSDKRLSSRPELFKPEDVQGYLGGNFARFALEACRTLLAAQGHGASAGRL
jgi:predicted TIM-barrel fold metal-dependent hydrolase